MTPYFLKTIACSAFLLAAYLLLLAREKMYTFNRLYLLLGIASSFIIPLFTIHTTAPQILAAPPAYSSLSRVSWPRFSNVCVLPTS